MGALKFRSIDDIAEEFDKNDSETDTEVAIGEHDW